MNYSIEPSEISSSIAFRNFHFIEFVYTIVQVKNIITEDKKFVILFLTMSYYNSPQQSLCNRTKTDEGGLKIPKSGRRTKADII